VQQSLGTPHYPPLRIGVGDPERPPGGPLTDFVLGPLGKRDAATVRELFPIMTDAIDAWIRGGIKPALDVQSRAKSG
jgi:peptidyl-tRNA hydrolase